jgi:hypothetical protein
MTRSRNKPPNTLVNRWFPHKVTLTAAAVSASTSHIALFYSQHDIGWRDQHTQLLRNDDQDYYAYAFADPQIATMFQALFGGELAIASPRPPSDPYDFS